MFRRIAKVFIWLAAILLVLLCIFHPPLVKWAVRKYSPEYTGRQVTLEHFRLNPFTGTVSVQGLKVMEAKSDTVFLSVQDILVDLTLYKMIAGIYEVTALHIHKPFIRIVQDGDRFNFSDLEHRFAPADSTPAVADTTPVRYALYDLLMDSARISYSSSLMSEPIEVTRADLVCEQLKWDVPPVRALLHVLLDNGSRLQVDIGLDRKRMLYDMALKVDSLPWKMMEPYVTPYMHISKMEGDVMADITMHGDVNDPMGFSVKGRVGTTGFAMYDPAGVKLLGVGQLDLVVDTIDVKQEKYRVRRLVLDSPYLFAELYDNGDNFTRLLTADSTTMGHDTAAVQEDLGYDPENPFSMLAHYVKVVAEDYAAMNYRVDSLGVVNGDIFFNDFTMEEPFHYELSDLRITADDINSGAKEIVLRAHSILNKDGTFDAELGVDPHSTRNMHLNYTVAGLGLPAFGPYTIHYVAHPIQSGRTQYVCNTTIVDNKLHSTNRILVEDFNFGSKMNVADAYHMPIRLAVSLLKDKHGDIKLDIPIEGDLDNPKYRVWPIVWQVIKNLLTKAISAPAAALARTFNVDENDLKAVRFPYLQQGLTNQQEKPLDLLSRVAKDRPSLKIELVQTGDARAEAEAYAIRTAKAAYFVDSTGVPIDTTVKDLDRLLESVDIKSPGFRAWIDGKVGASDQPVQKKCMSLVGQTNAEAEVERLQAVRRNVVEDHLKQEQGSGTNAIIVRQRTEQDTIPAGGVPAFIAVYKAAAE